MPVQSTLPLFPDGAPLSLGGKCRTQPTPEQIAEIMDRKAAGATWNQIRGWLGDAGFNGSRIRKYVQKQHGDRAYPWHPGNQRTVRDYCDREAS